MKLLIKNATVLDNNGESVVKDILLQGGIIIGIEDYIEKGVVECIDVEKKIVLPGLIDMNCYIPDPGFEYIENIASVSKSAVKGGFTTITCLPSTKPVIDDTTVVKYVIAKSRQQSLVNVFPYGSMSKGCNGKHISEIGAMREAGIVALSDGNICIEDSALLKHILLYSKMFDIPVITFCDDKNLAKFGVMNQGVISSKIGLEGIPREAEEIIVARNLILAEHTGARLHITHVSTAGSVSLIKIAKANGVKVTCDTCPHYFTLSEDYVEFYNTFGKVKPPLRTEKDIEAIKNGLADGTIDLIVSGHSPCSVESKKVEFDNAAFGITSLETTFALCYTYLVKEKILTLQQLIEKLSCTPAEILGLENKGQLKQGFDGDLIIIDTDQPYEVVASDFASKAKFSPYDKMELFGKIIYTIVNGFVTYIY